MGRPGNSWWKEFRGMKVNADLWSMVSTMTSMTGTNDDDINLDESLLSQAMKVLTNI